MTKSVLVYKQNSTGLIFTHSDWKYSMLLRKSGQTIINIVFNFHQVPEIYAQHKAYDDWHRMIFS